jgi:hypothetical protein
LSGYEPATWIDDLGASFEAALAREEEVAADDLAFSLRQDGDLRSAVRNGGWALLVDGERRSIVDEVGVDYVVAGDLVVRAGRAILRSAGAPAPSCSDRTFLELLGSACRDGQTVEVCAGAARVRGTLVRVAGDHLVVAHETEKTVVGLGAIDSVRICSRNGGPATYSDSRGFSG